jgi:hypothetical protein
MWKNMLWNRDKCKILNYFDERVQIVDSFVFNKFRGLHRTKSNAAVMCLLFSLFLLCIALDLSRRAFSIHLSPF